MFLKSLTLKGFKSFADRTTLEFEPGVTVVVGPNGSGKSNLVDAVAWVLGAQGPRTLRGGKMDDFIFAGTPGRAALGRAEVSLTIDNTAGLLPIEFTELTITRTLFRSGDSEYQLNGAPCRLLDIQELLSDTGIGRQQHVIVGQGQLDAVLNARPEDRRAIIEEAAGVLKYRKRRERAERRLEATEGNLLRLNDLVREVRRQLTPLHRQADAARRHGGIVAELRAIRLHLAGHEIAGLQARTERLRDTRTELNATDTSVRARLRELDEAVMEAEHTLTAMGDDDLAESLVRVESLRERGRGFAALVTEKQRGLERELSAIADEGVVETLVADAGAVRAELTDADERATSLGPQLDHLDEAETLVAEARAAIDSGALDRAVEDADVARDTAEARVSEADEHWRAAEAEVSRWRARAEALDLSLGAVRAAGGAAELDGIAGIEGPLVDHLEIEPGAEAAVASALGDAMRAVVVGSGDVARRALHRLADGDAHALLLVVDTAHGDATQGEFVPSGSRALLDCVRARLPGLQPVLAHLLARTVLVETGWEEALDLALAHQGLVVVTPAGDRFGGLGPWRVGGERGAGVTQAALDEAVEHATTAEQHRAATETAVIEARATLATARARAVTADEARRQAQADLDQRRAAATMLRRDLEVRAAAIEERRVVLARRLEEVERRLAARDPEAQATAERRRSGLVERAAAYEHLSGAIARHLAAVDTLHERLGERRRRQSEAARASGEQLDVLRGERATLEEQLAGVRERAGRAEIDGAETKLRLETAVEKLRTEFDCEAAVALDAPKPDVPEGTTLASRARARP